MRKLFKRRNKEENIYIPEKTRKEYRIALLPNMIGRVDFYTDGKGLVYIADKDCDFKSKDEFIKMGLIKIEDTDFYKTHIGKSEYILNTPWYLIDLDNYNVLEITKDDRFD